MRKVKKIITGMAMTILLIGSIATINAQQSGWVNNGKTGWTYIKEDGTKAIGWLRDGNMWYYLDGNGIMKTGWQQIGGKWYYLDSNGVMVTNKTIDGYYIGADGSWEENEYDLFYSYLKDKIIPTVGLSSLGHFDFMEYFEEYFDNGKLSIDNKYIGLISTYMKDVNYDGIEEMIIFYTKQENDERIGLDRVILYFDLYTIKDGKVSFLKNIGSTEIVWVVADCHQELKIGIKEYKNHIYLFMDGKYCDVEGFSQFLGYYDLTDLNNISYVNYETYGHDNPYGYYIYKKTLNNKTEELLEARTDDYVNYTFTGKYSSEEEVQNAIQKELNNVGLGKDRELNSQKILECKVHTMYIDVLDYTNIRDNLEVK